jgi:Trp operon repressor
MQLQRHRSITLELDSQDYSQMEIAAKLQVSGSTISRNMNHLRQQDKNLEHHIHEVLPEQYQRCMVGMQHNLKKSYIYYWLTGKQ